MRSPEMSSIGDGDNLTESESSREYRERFEEAVNTWYEKLTTEEPAIVRALELLNSLPSNLVYHVKAHTEDVIRETIRFVLEDNKFTKDELKTVLRQQAIAAAWHDVGFLDEQSEDMRLLFAEESTAIDMFRADEEFKNAPHKEAWETIGNIWDTRVIPKKDESLHLEMRNSTYGYMLDADVSNFGRDDFFEKLELVMEEAREKKRKMGKEFVQKDFYASVLSLLRNHSWKTESARRLREEKKRENLKRLQEMYDALPA